MDDECILCGNKRTIWVLHPSGGSGHFECTRDGHQIGRTKWVVSKGFFDRIHGVKKGTEYDDDV